MNWSKNGLSLSEISDNQCLKSFTLHFSRHFHVTCWTHLVHYLSSWLIPDYQSMKPQWLWERMENCNRHLEEGFCGFPPLLWENMNYAGQRSCFPCPLLFREVSNNHSQCIFFRLYVSKWSKFSHWNEGLLRGRCLLWYWCSPSSRTAPGMLAAPYIVVDEGINEFPIKHLHFFKCAWSWPSFLPSLSLHSFSPILPSFFSPSFFPIFLPCH